MFKAGQTVSYGSQGVCKLIEISEKEMCGKRAQYYVLKPVYHENNTIFVPVDNENLTSKMRSVLSKEEIKELINSIPNEKLCFIEDDVKRREEYKSILSSGDIRGIVGLIKSLYTEGQKRKELGKKLPQQDEIIFNRAETLLYDELALVLEIEPQEVLAFINEQIKINE